MLSGETLIDDGVLQRGMKPLKRMFDLKEANWPIMGWDVDGGYWVKNGTVTKISSKTDLNLFRFETTESQPQGEDSSVFECDPEHMILCHDGTFKPIKDVVTGDIRIQHVRGNGHYVRVIKVTPLGLGTAYGLAVKGTGCFIHNRTIHQESV